MKNYTRSFFKLATLCLLFNAKIYAQDDSLLCRPNDNRTTLGFSINQFQKDFGMGMNVSSPLLFNTLGFRLSCNLQWNEYTPVSRTETTWSPYFNFKIGALSKTTIIHGKLNAYSEGGLVIIVPNKDFSSKQYVLGGYGLIGVELIPDKHLNYFIELGGIGTGAQTDKSALNLIYSNGFLTSVGMRFKL